jgi:hypothetical protein
MGASRVGELAIGRGSILLKEAGHAIDLVPIHHHPDEAGLIGAVYPPPPWVLAGYEALLAVDIGGSNIRAGVVQLHAKKQPDGSRSEVAHIDLPSLIQEAIPEIADEKMIVMMHNDAVVQGLSQIPHVDDVDHWGVLTIGTGLGNAVFTNARRAGG